MVVLGNFTMWMANHGLMFSFGVLFPFILEEFQTSRGATSMIQSTRMVRMRSLMSFWLDMLWLHLTFTNYDVRFEPYAMWGAAIYIVGCAGFAIASARIVFSENLV